MMATTTLPDIPPAAPRGNKGQKPINVDEPTRKRFYKCCESRDLNKKETASRLLDWFSELDPTVQGVLIKPEFFWKERARIVLATLERIARDDPDNGELAEQALERIARGRAGERDGGRFSAGRKKSKSRSE